MKPTNLFSKLLDAGRNERYEDVKKLPGAGDIASVSHLSGTQLNTLTNYFNNLNELDQKSIIKAIAVYENTVGGLGSVTSLRTLLPLIDDFDNSVIDWILKNTNSYWYYSHGAKSFKELNAALQKKSRRREESLRREEERQAEAKLRKAKEATQNLFNAVRRGDIKAVHSLLAKGADPSICSPEGSTLYEYALSNGQAKIASLLKGEE